VSEYIEERRVVQDVLVGRRPVVETRYDSVVNERRGISVLAVVALVVTAITATVITMLIINRQQRNSHEELAQERARTAAAQQQSPQQQPVIVTMPPSQPAIVPEPHPVSVLAAPIVARTAPSSTSIEIEVTSRLQTDEELRPHVIDVKVTGRTAVLSGHVPDEELKKRAERIVRTVKQVQSIINDIVVRP
jgi:BON domain-containing protein